MLMSDSPDRYARIPNWLRDLAFVTDFFSWLFALCSCLAEPLMLLCTLYIVAEAGVPALALPALHNLAIGIMICAPEIILPGSFVVASRAQEHARLLFAVCWTFVVLTLLTLISLFVWHFTGVTLAWLMCARCSAAVGYSILMRVMSHGQIEPHKVSAPDVLTTLTEHLQGIEANIHRTVAVQIAETEQRITYLLSETLQSLEQTVTERIERTLSERSTAPALAELAALPAQLERQAAASQAQLRTLVQEVKTALEANATRPKLALVERTPSRTANTSESGIDKAAFVRATLTEHPEMRNADIQRHASEQGVNISPAYMSELRKAFTVEQSA
jgi:hypothetical protein